MLSCFRFRVKLIIILLWGWADWGHKKTKDWRAPPVSSSHSATQSLLTSHPYHLR